MKSYRLAWIALGSLVAACVGLGVGCGEGENNSSAASGTGECGNGRVEAGEECDDANTSDGDGCLNDCTLPVCGDGIVSANEECDDGNLDNGDGCSSTCRISCNPNGMLEPGEECDDGNMINDDECTNACTEPRCGDGIVQGFLGEDCDDGNNEIDDNCPNDCMNPSSGGGDGGDPCVGQQTFAGVVTNDMNPAQAGPGIGAVWAYGGQLGVQAGNDMCAAIGADHVCSYKEVLDADAAGELASVTSGTEFWVHRVTETVPRLNSPGMSPPGPGARCNDWTYPTNHIADGEFGVYLPVSTPPANATRIGNIDFYTDDDAAYTGDPADGHQCGGVTQGTAGTAGCAGNCGGAVPKAIFCCFPICQ